MRRLEAPRVDVCDPGDRGRCLQLPAVGFWCVTLCLRPAKRRSISKHKRECKPLVQIIVGFDCSRLPDRHRCRSRGSASADARQVLPVAHRPRHPYLSCGMSWGLLKGTIGCLEY